MKSSIAIIGLLLLSVVATPELRGEEVFRPDADGYIRNWVMLAPILLPERRSVADLTVEEQVKNEGALRPMAGDKVKIDGKELVWKNITASDKHFDFNEILDGIYDHAAGYMVTYIECDEEMKDLTMALGSNDQGRLYLNGKDIYAYQDARPLELDADKGNVTLKKGLNVIVFKVLNETNNWQGAMRFLDDDGVPVKDLKIKLAP